MLNPVRIGHHPKNHLVLDDAEVGAEALAVDNDVAQGGGWRLWNRNGRAVRIGRVALGERNQCVRLPGPRVVVDCWPFVLTLCLNPEEWEERVEPDRLDRSCANLVREVHTALVNLHPHDPEERGEWLRDEYVHRLEQEIAELAAARDDFSADNFGTSELAVHMAGVAVRSALVHRLAANSGPTTEPDWARVRLSVPELEAELARIVESAEFALDLRRYPSLTEQVGAVDAGYWNFWQTLTEERRLAPRVLRYLAIRRLTEEVKDVWYGFGPLEDLLDDPTVTEVMVVSADQIFVEKNGRIERSGRRFLTDPLITIQRVMGQANRQINTAQPFADARMADGSRAHAIIPPLALRGPCLTIRRFPTQPLTIDKLVNEYRALSPAARDFLRAAVVGRLNVIVSGGTGTGKTTLLNCLSGFIPDRERIVTVEDTAELQLQKEHVVSLQARPKNGEGAGEVSIRELVRNALRMRPDRIVVGECREGEALDMLQAMNTGHDGSMTTLHANDPQAAIDRLVVLVQRAAGSNLPVSAIHQQIVSALDLIVQLEEVVRDGRKYRIVSQIAEVAGYDPEDAVVRLVPLFRARHGGPLTATGHLPTFLPDLIARGLVADPVAFIRDADFS